VQRYFNLAGALGFLMSGTLVVGSLVLYTRIPSLTKLYISDLKLELTQLVMEMVPAKIEKALPQLPTSTGPAVELPKSPF